MTASRAPSRRTTTARPARRGTRAPTPAPPAAVPAPPHLSLFDRTIGRRRSAWATLGWVVLVYLPSLAAAYQLRVIDIFTDPANRGFLAAPTVIAYLLLVGPTLSSMKPTAIASIRAIVQVDGDELNRLVERTSLVSPAAELASILAGTALGILIFSGPPGAIQDWPGFILFGTGYAMMGLLGWTTFHTIVGTRPINAMLRRPVNVDPLDLKPFEPIGRMSLVLALIFVGGITLGLVLGTTTGSAILDFRFWLLYLPLSLVPVAVFFINLRPTHRVLADARTRELTQVRRALHGAYRRLLQMQQADQPLGDLPSVLNGLGAYEKALTDARTWPYNTATLRTLGLSLLIPLLTVLFRQVLEVYIR